MKIIDYRDVEPKELTAATMTNGKDRTRRSVRPGLWIALVLLGAGAVFWWLREPAGKAQVKSPSASRPVSVTVATARLGNVPVTLSGIGTVTPLRNVTVRSRVDGELLEVRFREGQIVKEGDLLARIDPRPFQAQYDQYQGQHVRELHPSGDHPVHLAFGRRGRGVGPDGVSHDRNSEPKKGYRCSDGPGARFKPCSGYLGFV